jgi:hypothetical protein
MGPVVQVLFDVGGTVGIVVSVVARRFRVQFPIRLLCIGTPSRSVSAGAVYLKKRLSIRPSQPALV